MRTPSWQFLGAGHAVAASGAGPPVAEVPTAIAATRQPNAQVKLKELIIVLVNFVFIFSLFVLAFRDFSLCRLRLHSRAPACQGENHF